MTDRSNEIDPAERVRQLQARRAASGRTPRPAASARVATAPSARAKPRRRHPAAATRWLLGGLSIVSFVGIAGTVAAAAPGPSASPVASTPATVAPTATPATAATPVTAKATSTVHATAPVAHTTTRGS